MSSLVIESDKEKETLLCFVQDIDAPFRDAASDFVKNILVRASGNVAGALVESASKLVPGGDLVLKLCAGVYGQYQALGKLKTEAGKAIELVTSLAENVSVAEKELGKDTTKELEDAMKEIIRTFTKYSNRNLFQNLVAGKTLSESLKKHTAVIEKQCGLLGFHLGAKNAQRLNKVEGCVDNLAAEVQALKVGQPTTKLSLEDVLNVVRVPFNHKAKALLYVPGTRERMIAEVIAWCKSVPSRDSLGNVIARVRCHLANAGMGKTVVSSRLLTIDRLAKNIVAYHFCRHDDINLSNPLSMLKSIAWQLCQNSEFGPYKKLLNTPTMIGRIKSSDSLSTLFRLLFLEPLSNCKLDIKHRRVILIDALDECDASILTVIETYFSDNSLPDWLAFLLTSRPEEDIDQALNIRKGPSFLSCRVSRTEQRREP